MNVIDQCPNPVELSELIQYELSEADTDRVTQHIQNCTTCQQKLQTIASGDVPVEELVQELKEQNPEGGSAFWATIERLSDEVRSQQTINLPGGSQASSADTSSFNNAGKHDSATPPPHIPASTNQPEDLSFLEPSDDPAYHGKLQHFQIARVIGRGGMGVVLEGFDTHLQRSVAIKVLNAQYQQNDLARQRFCREGRAAAAISHEHVVQMFQVAKANDDGIAYLVMQLIEGETLENRLREGQSLPPNEVARIGMQTAAGLSAAHKRGMVHRDIKPANIMIESETNRVKLTDFGLARTADDVKLTKTGMVTGTPLYMSPEQSVGEEADERSDLFSLGAVMYEMATGVPPFQAPSALGVMQRIVNHHPEPPHKINPSVTRPLSDLIMSLLEKSADDRPESAAEVATALASIVSEYGPISPLQVPSIAASEVKKLSGSYRRGERRWAIAAWVTAALAIMVALASFMVMRPDLGDDFPSVVLPDNPGTVWASDFSPDGGSIASAVEDGSVRIWDVGTQTLKKSFNAHRDLVWSVAYHPTRPMLMTSGGDAMIKLWDTKNYEVAREWKATSSVRGVAFSPDGNRIVAGDRDGVLHVWDIDSGDEVASVETPGSILGVDYSADGRLVASVGHDKVVRLFDAETLEERQSMSGHDGVIYNVRFAPTGPLVATVGWNKNVRVWNSETGTEVLNLEGSEGDVWSVSFCTDASHLITGEQMGAARVWNLAAGKPVATLRGHSSAVYNVALNPASHHIATSSRDGTVRVWDMSCVAK
ncbi:WD40 repeat domain-containing serine/threonine protein kinase [Rhodopirellula sallentina]|uniref:non-specific serine/threonine protein kinase n=1 Tax=Rhodopirellula sallentina SM41 TaxID=1263870 RepID=M5U883_9BACT|nr:serine/threonine-protein kinase [Rhodopirellula sallentina]EMI57655.1 serine/threonine protein kinase [Rhodopirellula sallentina SM41]